MPRVRLTLSLARCREVVTKLAAKCVASFRHSGPTRVRGAATGEISPTTDPGGPFGSIFRAMKTDGKHEKRRGNETGQPQPEQRPGQGGQPGQQWPGKVSQPATRPATTWPGQPGQPGENR